ncbi:MAG: MerR family transcriptional regulator [Defluviitaleaceae bacterium]|nr:MerR family transcriptional regulator [Defluviitaleaceae bacterium]MCL2238498.1 MerR family transcriptional regulator [Defluviitaleaceae bacterium]
MENYRAIPQGYMTVGEIAKKMGVTVRTLQYYDKEGLLSPSAQSEGGRRLYTGKDVVKLHQIQSMKYLGFSLEDIKSRLPSINTPQEVAELLAEQAGSVREKIKSLKDILVSLEKLSREVIQIEEVDWAKYANIVYMLIEKSVGYWVMKYMTPDMFDTIHNRHDTQSSEEMGKQFKLLMKRVGDLKKQGFVPESDEAQAFAKAWWDFTMKFTNGDTHMLGDLFEMGDKVGEGEWKENFFFDKEFLEQALSIYFQRTGINPYEGMKKND